MNEKPKIKFYKRWWFAFVLGLIVGPMVSIGVLFLMAYPQYLTPTYWVGRVSGDIPSDLSRPAASTAPAYFELREQDANGNYVPTGLDNRYLVVANVNFDSVTQSPRVEMQFNAEGGKLIETITTRNVGKAVGFFVNGKLVMAPTVAQAISGGSLTLFGNLSLENTKALAQGLNAGRGLTQKPK